MCERAIKPWCVGRCSCAARLQVADLWGVVNQRFGACGVSWIRSSVQLFRGTSDLATRFISIWCESPTGPRTVAVAEVMFMGLRVQNNLLFCTNRFCKYSFFQH